MPRLRSLKTPYSCVRDKTERLLKLIILIYSPTLESSACSPELIFPWRTSHVHSSMSSHSSQLTLVGKPATTTPRPCSTCFTATTSTDRGIVLKRRLHVVPHVAMREATGTKVRTLKGGIGWQLGLRPVHGQLQNAGTDLPHL